MCVCVCVCVRVRVYLRTIMRFLFFPFMIIDIRSSIEI